MINILSIRSCKKFLIRLYILIILLCSIDLLIAPITALGSENSKMHPSSHNKNVLILTSFNSIDNFESNLSNYLINNIHDANFTIENLSLLGRNNSYLDTQAKLLSEKYSNIDFDLIIALNDEALKFTGTYHNLIVKDTPVIFGGISYFNYLSQYPFNRFTGIIKNPNINSLLDFILDIHPSISTINIILDESLFALNIENSLRSSIPYYGEYVKFNFINASTIDDISKELSPSHLNEPIIILGSYTDKNGTVLSPDEIIDEIKSVCFCPIYTLDGNFINSKVIGGCFIDTKSHGKILTELVDRQLASKDVIKIPPVYDNNSVFKFNYNELKVFHIDRGSLPPNAIVSNSPWLSINSIYVIIGIVLLLILIFIITVQKIINRKNINLEKKKYEQAVYSDQLKTEFIANFSHELRTLLNVMLSGLQLLDIYVKSGDVTFKNHEQEQKLVYVRQSGLKLLKLINNLIDLTKLDAGYFNTNFEKRNIIQVIEDITMSVVEFSKSRGIDLIFDTNEEDVFMSVDSEKMDRIMLNLLSNAIKFTPAGGTIFVNINCDSSNIVVSIKDSGIGIPKEKQESIFDRFTQVNSSLSRHNEGSGIGLSLVKSLVELLGGTITLESETNQGCKFTFKLPIKIVDDSKSSVDISSHNLQKNTDKILVELSDINEVLKS